MLIEAAFCLKGLAAGSGFQLCNFFHPTCNLAILTPLKFPLPYRDEDIVPVIVSFSEKTLRDVLKSAGEKWNPEEKVWHVPYGSIRGNTELEMRILED